MNRPLPARWISNTVLHATAFTLMVVLSGNAAADEGVAAEALAPGSWSVQFSVKPNLTLGSYSGSTLSLKRHLAGGKALRFGVSPAMSVVRMPFASTAATAWSSLSAHSPRSSE